MAKLSEPMGQGFLFHCQFLKDGSSSEVQALQKAMPEIQVLLRRTGFIVPPRISSEDIEKALTALGKCQEIIEQDCPDLMILDEICTAVSLGVLSEKQVLRLLEMRPENAEFVLTGRNASPGIIEASDLVTEMREIKHPFSSGQSARRGIEY